MCRPQSTRQDKRTSAAGSPGAKEDAHGRRSRSTGDRFKDPLSVSTFPLHTTAPTNIISCLQSASLSFTNKGKLIDVSFQKLWAKSRNHYWSARQMLVLIPKQPCNHQALLRRLAGSFCCTQKTYDSVSPGLRSNSWRSRCDLPVCHRYQKALREWPCSWGATMSKARGSKLLVPACSVLGPLLAHRAGPTASFRAVGFPSPENRFLQGHLTRQSAVEELCPAGNSSISGSTGRLRTGLVG